jgi:hypothetical protein
MSLCSVECRDDYRIMNWEGYEREWLWPDWRYSTIIFLDALKKTRKTALCKRSRSPNRNLNQGPSVYGAAVVITIRPWRSGFIVTKRHFDWCSCLITYLQWSISCCCKQKLNLRWRLRAIVVLYKTAVGSEDPLQTRASSLARESVSLHPV